MQSSYTYMNYSKSHIPSKIREHPSTEYCYCGHQFKNHNINGCKIFMCQCTERNTTKQMIIVRLEGLHHRMLSCPVCDKCSLVVGSGFSQHCTSCGHNIGNKILLLWHGFFTNNSRMSDYYVKKINKLRKERNRPEIIVRILK